ncbi:hypothetical protein V6N12_003383 [Hibiscus sabdariffa]|uniref:Uncharacterized protein n=1 Tax=Hibiscus sabdariffa TaxID=183260 RepID=A0ABR2B5A1_9ROSI
MSDSMPVVCTIDSKNPQWTPGEMQRELFECEKKGREKFSLHYDSVWLDKFKQIQFPPFGYVVDSPVMRVSEDVGLSFGFVFGPETSLPFVNGVVHLILLWRRVGELCKTGMVFVSGKFYKDPESWCHYNSQCRLLGGSLSNTLFIV